MVGSESRVLSHLNTAINVHVLPEQYSRALSAVSEDQLLPFIRSIYFEFKNNPSANREFKEFLDIVNLSGYSFGDWIKNINFIFSWLTERDQKAKFADIVQYVSCYYESQSSDSIGVFLELFGFERAETMNQNSLSKLGSPKY